jgi:putative dimethyl sulfoxide reductase chaperone
MGASLEKLTELIKNRAQLYSFFSRIYMREVDEELLLNMKRSIPINIDDTEMAGAYNKLREILERSQINEEYIENLAADFASLFLGIGRYPAYPYESVYLSQEGIIMGESRDKVLKMYLKEGLQKMDWFKEPEDHIAIELEFMAFLCLKMQEALSAGSLDTVLRLIETQRDFFEKHLKSWVPKFCDDIIKHAFKYDFYQAMANITKRYILLEEATVLQMAKELKNDLMAVESEKKEELIYL